MIFCADSSKVEQTAIQRENGGSNPTSALHLPRNLLVFPVSLGEIRGFIEANHYSHSINGVKCSFCFKILAGSELVGAAIFGAMSTTAWKKFSNLESSVVELRRLVLLDSAGKNCESRVLGWMLRWLKKHSPNLQVVVSYADPMFDHHGTIYRAANFIYLGKSSPDSGYRDLENGKLYHSRALRTRGDTGEYKPFVKRLREKLKLGKLEKIPLPGKHCYIFPLK